MNEWKLKEQICQIGRRLYEKNYVAANDGNISVRLGPGRFLCTPTLVSKGFMTPAGIAVVDDEGNQISGDKPRTSEIRLHLEIYHEMPEINAVVHAHPPHATAFAVAGVELPNAILPEVEIFIGQVPIARYDTPGSKDFAETILPHLRNKANTILLANHGAVSCGRTLQEAYFHLETLDQYCRILLLTRQIGKVHQLSGRQVQELLEIKQQMGIDDPRIGCEGEACVLAGSDEFLRGFSERAIPQHTADANGHGRGYGIAGSASQAGQPQPAPAAAPAAAPAPARRGPMGSSSRTVQKRAMDDEVERLTQLITDRIVERIAKG
ncbi:MAG: class II aldolase/adducin family protein [Planctomycetota bacterium]|jgi:L-fuculose-phosphate aldolase